jgi:hypothetical protein
MTTAVRQDVPPRARGPAERQIEHRLERVMARLGESRMSLRQAHSDVRAAGQALLQRRQDRERAAEALAVLAELAESLQRSLEVLQGLDARQDGIK